MFRFGSKLHDYYGHVFVFSCLSRAAKSFRFHSAAMIDSIRMEQSQFVVLILRLLIERARLISFHLTCLAERILLTDLFISFVRFDDYISALEFVVVDLKRKKYAY